MNQLALMQKFYSVLPAVRQWIEKTLEKNQNRAVPVIDIDFPRIKNVFSPDFLSRAKAVVVSGKAPFPPLGSLGLSEFDQMENMPIAGITYKDTFFVGQLYQTDESLYFHELVHIVQWDRLGVDNFLLTYALGLKQFGYEDIPLEKMAYSLQADFDNGMLPNNIIKLIYNKTDAVWKGVTSSFP